MRQVFAPALLVVAGIAGVHRGAQQTFPPAGSSYLERVEHPGALPQTAYDLPRIGAWR
jgi:hypothetical protein